MCCASASREIALRISPASWCLQWTSLVEKSGSSWNWAGLSHCRKCETWVGQGLEEEGLQKLSFTDSEFSSLTW